MIELIENGQDKRIEFLTDFFMREENRFRLIYFSLYPLFEKRTLLSICLGKYNTSFNDGKFLKINLRIDDWRTLTEAEQEFNSYLLENNDIAKTAGFSENFTTDSLFLPFTNTWKEIKKVKRLYTLILEQPFYIPKRESFVTREKLYRELGL